MIDENIDELEQDNEEDDLFLHQKIVVDKGQVLMRIDKYLPIHSKKISRSKVQESIDSEAIKVNGKPTKASYQVKPEDVITLELTFPKQNLDLIAEDLPLDIIYEDDELLIVNKKPGMVAHPSLGHRSGTLVNGLIYHFNNLPTHRNGEIRPGLVHRIDKDTSGLLVIAKTDYSMSFLAKQFADHSIERTYYALVWGLPKEDKGTINKNISRNLKNRKICDVFADPEIGKHAITHYEVLERFSNTSLIKCNLETGRTHQIRVHMKSIGHTLFNDSEYSGNMILKGHITQKYRQFVDNCFELLPRQGLHAKSLGFIHPTSKKWVQFDTELPEDMQKCLEKWRNFIH
jgi:23S rRNA pseudouridine1911/1915/1917 synthase